jgi:hypothetical protein
MARRKDGPPGSIRLPLMIGAGLIVLFVALSFAFQKDKKKTVVKTEGSRAVVLPAADRARTVVVPPCSPPTVITPENASNQFKVPGAVSLTIPQGAPPRTLVIPRCAAKAKKPTPGAANLPSSLFLLGPGAAVSETEKVPKGGNPVAFGIKPQVTVPTNSPVETIVAAPCQQKPKAARTTVLKPVRGSLAIAPGC